MLRKFSHDLINKHNESIGYDKGNELEKYFVNLMLRNVSLSICQSDQGMFHDKNRKEII